MNITTAQSDRSIGQVSARSEATVGVWCVCLFRCRDVAILKEDATSPFRGVVYEHVGVGYRAEPQACD